MNKKDEKRSRIYLMRHGQAAPVGLMVGSSDCPLSPKGQIEISAWCDFFAPIALSAVWASPLQRAQDSAKIITCKLNSPIAEENFHTEHGFREISLGEWEGMPKEAVQLKYPAQWQSRGRNFMHYAPPGGESFTALAQRVLHTFNSLYEQIIRHEQVLIMAHQAVNRAILAAFGQAYAQSWLDIPQDYAALNELELLQKPNGGFSCKIISINARPPL